MDEIEKLIKEYLESNLDSDRANKTPHCPDENVLLDYMGHRLDSQECRIIENHIAGCSFCLSQLSLACQAQMVSKQGYLPYLPQELVNKVRELLKTDKNRSGRKMIRNKKIKKNLFLAGASIFFILSFLIPRYFLQFLVGTLILGIRWTFESESGRTLIMVLDSWRRRSHDEDEEISHRLRNRF